MALLAAYNFDEASGNVLDLSGNGRHFALNANLQRTAPGHTNGGATKNGVGMPVVASPSFVGTSAWTVMFWQQGLGDTVWWVRFYNTAADTGSGILLLGGTLRVRIRTTGNTEASITPPSDGAWHHYAATYDGTVGRLYLDGVLSATTGTAAAPTAAVDRIDMMEWTLPNTFRDDLRFHDEALDQATIAALKDTPVGSAPPAFSGSVTLSATAALLGSGARSSTGAASMNAAAAVTAGGVRTSGGVVPLAAAAALAPTGARSASASASLSATASLAAHQTSDLAPAPPGRSFVVPASNRTFTVPAETRSWEV